MEDRQYNAAIEVLDKAKAIAQANSDAVTEVCMGVECCMCVCEHGVPHAACMHALAPDDQQDQHTLEDQER